MNPEPNSIHERIETFDRPSSVDTPIAMSRFVQLCKEYISYTRTVRKGSDHDQQEKATCRTFLAIVKLPHVWPVVQCLIEEFQYPMKDLEEDGTIFREILRILKRDKTPPQILPTPSEYDLWEQETYWTRVTAAFDYLTFAWEHQNSAPGAAGKRRADERAQDAKVKVTQFIDIVTQAMGDADLAQLDRGSDDEDVEAEEVPDSQLDDPAEG
ncbi:hypothetical protein EDD37DRAFT_371788 [Exophiala viscosa]|uniref:uncharacterized protein n=1 Tax=Exophiala viscosa TaxID=2486360 RepID=UPI00219145A2|nr:hypothetical protein EDD37DRAFT_371788 [Exophiala viscosa]